MMKLANLLKNKIEVKHVYTIIMIIIYIYLIMKCIFEYIWGSGLDGCKLELVLMIVFSFIIYIFSFFQLDIFHKKFLRKDRIKSIKSSKKRRIFESIFLSLILTTFVYLLIAYDVIYIDFYSLFPNQIFLSIVGLLVILFFAFFIFSYMLLYHISKFIITRVK